MVYDPESKDVIRYLSVRVIVPSVETVVSRGLRRRMTIFPDRVSAAPLRLTDTPAGMFAVTVNTVWSPISITEVSGFDVTLISWADNDCTAKRRAATAINTFLMVLPVLEQRDKRFDVILAGAN